MKSYYFSVNHMSVGYDGVPVVKEMEIGLAQGEILSLIGPNGAGKSTVLKSIAGQLKPLGGAAYLDGEALTGMRADRLARKLSVVYTERVRTEMLSCRDVVATGRYPYTGRFGFLSGEDERVVAEAMALVQVGEIAGQDFRRVSDGQKQRVMLARAICQEPEVLLLDEPTSYLDIRYKLEFLSLIRKLRAQKGLTVIMSLHELELAKLVSDKLLCLKGEYIERFGTPAEVFTSDFIGRLFDIDEEALAADAALLAYARQVGGM